MEVPDRGVKRATWAASCCLVLTLSTGIESLASVSKGNTRLLDGPTEFGPSALPLNYPMQVSTIRESGSHCCALRTVLRSTSAIMPYGSIESPARDLEACMCVMSFVSKAEADVIAESARECQILPR